MNNAIIKSLKIQRKLISTFFNRKKSELVFIENSIEISQIIYNTLIGVKPCMIARFGCTELLCLTNYIGIKYHKNQYLNFIIGKSFPFWWEESIIKQMQIYSGFFPPTEKKIEQFCDLMLQDMQEVSILGSWLPDEMVFEKELRNATKVRFVYLEPFWSENPWTRALEGKKVLVVHPFAKTIESQYKKRELLFENNLLPEFQLKTIQAVQSVAGNATQFKDWFEALEYMKSEIDKQDYDICLIGAGAYGFPLAAHVKRSGKKAVHLGGSLQLLFGIKGKRWEDENFDPVFKYTQFMNEHWTKADSSEKPINSESVEGACYW